MNKTVTNEIKRRLKAKKEKWAEELYHVLRAYRVTGQTPYAMAFSMWVVIPIKISLPTQRPTDFDLALNVETTTKELDLTEGQRDLARIKIAKYQQKLERGYNRLVRPRSFKEGDWVMRKVCEGKKKKLHQNWEGQ